MLGSWKRLAAVATLFWLSPLVPAYGAPDFVGQWERKTENSTLVLTLTENNRLHLSVHGKDQNFTLHGDYNVTKDGLIFGVVTSVDSDEEELEAFIDQPFSFRSRVDEGALVLGPSKGFGIEPNEVKPRLMIRGRYRNTQPANVVSPPPNALAPSSNSTTSYSPSRERISSPAPQPASGGLVPAGR